MGQDKRILLMLVPDYLLAENLVEKENPNCLNLLGVLKTSLHLRIIVFQVRFMIRLSWMMIQKSIIWLWLSLIKT